MLPVRSLPLTLLAAAAALSAAPVALRGQAATGAPEPDSTLAALDFMTGRWRVPPEVAEQNPALAELVILDLRWTVGGKALAWREHVRAEGPDGAELEGIVYWDPTEERIELLGVAGRGEGQGRLFVGELVLLADGRIEKVYDVHYRTLADTPGEELGGTRRRFREVFEPAGPDRLVHTLEWWRDGRWQPWARGRYELVRATGGPIP